MRPKIRKLLDSAIHEKNSPLFLSKNKKEIIEYFEKRGFDVEERDSFIDKHTWQSSHYINFHIKERMKNETGKNIVF